MFVAIQNKNIEIKKNVLNADSLYQAMKTSKEAKLLRGRYKTRFYCKEHLYFYFTHC